MATVSNIYWTSSSPVFSQALYTGPSTEGTAPDYEFLTRAGLNGTGGNPNVNWEQSLTVPAGGGVSNTTVGRSTWDSLHGAPGARPFHSIFQVRFVMTHESVLASAGTTSFLEDAPQNFDSIEKIRISARVKNQGADPTAHREVNWESAEVMFQYNNSVPNENREFYYLTALPRATSPQKRKLSSLADKNLQVGDHFEQYLELSAAGDPKFIGLELVALASFRANDPAFPQSAFGPDDLQLRIAVWAPIP